MRQKVNQEKLDAPWKTIPGELLDHQGLPIRLTGELGKKTNKYNAPTIKGEKTSEIKCEMCNSKMEWDKEVGYFFCTECRYSVASHNLQDAKTFKEKIK